jgi:hypothetical protein
MALLAVFVVVMAGFSLSGCDDSEEPSSPAEPDPRLEWAIPDSVTVTGGEEPPINIPLDNGFYYDIRVFKTTGALTFPAGTAPVEHVDYLIVAGGGGGGSGYWSSGASATDFAGGGGAGGLLYKTGQTLQLEESGSVAVTVGTGGAGGSTGADGWYSAIGSIAVPGGGGGGAGNSTVAGRKGGSGGGGGSGSSNTRALGGTGKSHTSGNSGDLDSDIKGADGGSGSNAGNVDGGGGGGGAGVTDTGDPGTGGNGVAAVGGTGGPAWVPDDAWITQAANTAAFSKGGDGADRTTAESVHGAHYGDGGSAGRSASGNGHGGIVIIRFLRYASSK